jgi:hypothetical protein
MKHTVVITLNGTRFATMRAEERSGDASMVRVYVPELEELLGFSRSTRTLIRTDRQNTIVYRLRSYSV